MMRAGVQPSDLLPCTARVVVDGKPMTTTTASAKAAIGLVPQDIAIYPDLTARENLSFFGHLYGLAGGDLKRRIDEVLEHVAEQCDVERSVDERGDRCQVDVGDVHLGGEPSSLFGGVGIELGGQLVVDRLGHVGKGHEDHVEADHAEDLHDRAVEPGDDDLAAAFRQAQAKPSQVRVRTEGFQDVVRRGNQQAPDHRIAGLGDPQLWVLFTGLTLSWSKTQIRSDGTTAFESIRILHGQNKAQCSQRSNP